jgi:XTP/dITP diphosphohydrolase
MKKIILATSNKGKQKEINELLAPLHIQLLSNHELDHKLIPNVVEDGSTFEENAVKKARAYYERFGLPALADDSGLEVDFLDGRPGIYSARYAGEESKDKENYEKLLVELKGVPFEKRKANFTCAIAYVDGNETLIAKGRCEGYIAEAPMGEEGFGYDPVFLLTGEQKTMAQLSKEEKNQRSHRFHALQDLVKQLMPKNID